MSSEATNHIMTMIESLPIEAKTALVDQILNSLQPIDKDIDDQWAIEVERRMGEIRSGEVTLVPGDEVFRKIEERYQR